MSNKMKPTFRSSEIDLRTWQFFDKDDPTGGLRDTVMAGFADRVTHALRDEFEKSPPELEFAYTYSDSDDTGLGNPPIDPATILVSLPLNAKDDLDECCYSCSLDGAVNKMIWFIKTSRDTDVDIAEAARLCAKVAARLRELADKLDIAAQSMVSKSGD